MKAKHYILSPCGTSLLTNQAKDTEERKLIFTYANEKSKNSIPHNHRDQLERLIKKTSAKIDQADYQQATQMSAELNGIIKIYQGVISANDDFHCLISTDTWLGHETAKLVEQWLKNQNLIVNVHRHKDLQTQEIVAFQLSLSELINKFSEELPAYSNHGYKIIFNLTGGFKSVQGFLQSIANFYADETVYIFETASELLRIPRLPIRLDALPIVEENINWFRKMAAGLSLPPSNTIPETLLFEMEGQISLSPWGELVWSQSKHELYRQRLFPSPSPAIQYGKNFEKEIASLAADRIELINNRIDQLARYLENNAYNPASLDFKCLKGTPMKPSTHEIDAWSDSDAQRMFGHFEDEVFVLDKLDKGLH